jgi:uncharacterized protein involved in outer membrane biogenesis
MNAAKFLTVVLRIILISLALLALVIGILSFANITLPLESARKQFTEHVTELTGHEVRIDGEVRLAINFYPTLVVNRLHIANATGWTDEDILGIEKARVQLALLPILSGRMEFLEVAFESVQLNLEQARDGTKNWSSFFPPTQQDSQVETPETDEHTEPAAEKPRVSEKIWIEEFSITDLDIHYRDRQLGTSFNNTVGKLVINTRNKDHLEALLQGIANNIPYEFTARSGLLRDLLNGKPWKIELAGNIAKSKLDLLLGLDIADDQRTGNLSLSARDIDIGRTLSSLGVVKNLDAASEEIDLKATLTGSNLAEILENSNFSAKLRNGHWNLHDPADDDFRKIEYRQISLASNHGQPVKLDMDGRIENHPLKISLSTNRLKNFFSRNEKVHMDLSADIAGSTISAKGDFKLPLSDKSFALHMTIQGERLDQWNNVIKKQIPPYGPYQLSGKMRMTKEGFDFTDFKGKIGQSQLDGTMHIKTTGNQADLALELTSQKFQIRDFDVEGHSLFKRVSVSGKTEAFDANTGQPAKQYLDDDRQVTAPGKELKQVPAINADIRLSAREVLSGDDSLGSGSIHVILSEKALSFERFHLDLPGGNINGTMSVSAVQDGIKGDLKLDMDKFNYGVIYRYLQPESVADGLITLKTDLSLEGKDLHSLLDNANGTIDFAVWPENIDASILNLWSVNLFLAILPKLKEEKSTLNCATVLLDIEDGELTEELLLVDSTKVWMRGNLKVSFPNKTVSLVLVPKSKKAKLFSLQAPVRVGGTFDDLGAQVKPFDLVGAYFSFITSPLLAPVQRAFDKKIPADASKLCGQFTDRDYLRKLKKEIEAQKTEEEDFD